MRAFVDQSPHGDEVPSGVRPKTLPPAPMRGNGPSLADVICGETVDPELVLALVAARYGRTVDAIRGRGRQNGIAKARLVAYWLLRRGQRSFPEVARLVGNRDHTTIMSGVKRVDRECQRDPRVRAELEALLDAVDDLAGMDGEWCRGPRRPKLVLCQGSDDSRACSEVRHGHKAMLSGAACKEWRSA